MTTDQIRGDEYQVEYDSGSSTVRFQGTVRLQTTDDYAPVNELLLRAHDAAAGGQLSLDFRQLQFLNSSGISMVSKFVIGARKRDQVRLTVLGNRDIYWQQKSLGNLQKLWPNVQIEIL
ncbi:hypothetical protein K2Z83_13840 [Oscillochloris sp. ZM17-4]|uniref:slr1659 superfamily regulator n=1 Tax=Oscillochloris sp. ZM17-4 TaxID=2866714 RepID=UPI001C732497|nr:hypothetical protein [Oscillochloris sp. ZM17-4]MBX0328756.1 hypothetical protein [Oscillochloris sp. ZM17-4]